MMSSQLDEWEFQGRQYRLMEYSYGHTEVHVKSMGKWVAVKDPKNSLIERIRQFFEALGVET